MAPTSILFGVEKFGNQALLDTAKNILTDESRLLHGGKGPPILLRKRLNEIVAAFKRRSPGPLPSSIAGLWKADLFVGCQDTDKWLGTTVKINERSLQGHKGLRLGIVPAAQGASDKVRKDEDKNLIVCPIPHDQSFMEAFYTALAIVQAVLAASGKMPTEKVLPQSAHRAVARLLTDRSDVPVIEIVDQCKTIFGQRDLMSEEEVPVREERMGSVKDRIVDTIISPFASVIR
jgi:hypothetical protein